MLFSTFAYNTQPPLTPIPYPPPFTGSIVTESLAFYVEPADGIFVVGGLNYVADQITGYEGGVDAGVVVIDNNYFANFDITRKIIFNTSSAWYFNNPTIGDFSIELWAYYSSSMTSSGKIVSPLAIASNGENESMFGGFASPTEIYTLIPSKEEFNTTLSANMFSRWVHIVTTYDYQSAAGGVTTTYAQYSDGTTIYSGSDVSFEGQGPRDFSGNLIIGGFVGAQSSFAVAFNNGYIGPVRVYNKILSLDEITQNYEAELYRFS
jgi:hypothetical protein